MNAHLLMEKGTGRAPAGGSARLGDGTVGNRMRTRDSYTAVQGFRPVAVYERYGRMAMM
jgi:hypothetical protein